MVMSPAPMTFSTALQPMARREACRPTGSLPSAQQSSFVTGALLPYRGCRASGVAGYRPSPDSAARADLLLDRNQALDAFVRAGEDAGIRNRYKCRVRNPWWRVPGLVQADLFLPYMIGNEPHASVNRCRALYPNSLHGIHLFTPALSEQVALGLLSSLSLLSMELEGRSYGGGILKLEPTEMQRVRLIMPVAGEQGSRSAFEQADRLIRDREFHAANAVADDMILRQGIGLPDADVRRLREACQMLLERRTTRGRSSR